MNLDTTRLAIHVGNQTFDGGVMCEKMLINVRSIENFILYETFDFEFLGRHGKQRSLDRDSIQQLQGCTSIGYHL